MKRVLFVDHVDRILGGAEINLLELLESQKSLKEIQWTTAVACSPLSPLAERLSLSGVEIIPHQFSSSLNQLRVVGRFPSPISMIKAWKAANAATSRLAERIKEWRPSVVVSCANKDHFCAVKACRSVRVPSVWWVNDIVSEDFFPWLFRRLYFKKTFHAQRLVPVSEYARQALLDGGVPPWKAVTVLNGIPIQRYLQANQPEFRKIFREKFNIPESSIAVAIVGRLTPWKGQRLFLDLAEKALRENVNAFTFVVIGKAFNEDQDYESELRQRVENSEILRTNVKWVPFQDQIEFALAGIDLLAHTSVKPEPFGRTLIEAMSMGKPVLAARAGGVPEIITHGQDGWLAEPGSVESYLEGLLFLAGNEDRRVEMGLQAAKTASERFDVARAIRQFDEIFNSVESGAGIKFGSRT